MKVLDRFAAIFDRTNNLLAYLAGAILLFAVISVTTDVVLRYFFNKPLMWAVEINENNLLYITFLATAWVLTREGHVKVELVLNRLSPRAQNLMGLITSALGIIVCLVITWHGALVTWRDFQIGAYEPTILKIPNAYVLFIIPLGAFLLFIQFARRTHGFLKRFRTP